MFKFKKDPVDNIRKRIDILKELKTPEIPIAIEKRASNKPALSLLKRYNTVASADSSIASILENKLQEFGIEGKVINIRKGPVITRYEIQLGKGERLETVRRVSEDLSIALMGRIRIQAPIPGTSLVGIEIANQTPATIGLKSILKTVPKGEGNLTIALGTDIIGNPKILDLTMLPHLLIAGQTGSGKSVCLNSIILSLLYNTTPEECQLVLVDPKRVEMVSYNGIKNLLCPVITEPEDATEMFKIMVKEMETRYTLLAASKVRNIDSFNKMNKFKMPYIVIVVDEMADLMMTAGKELEKLIVRLAQMARAVGIHLVLATQKPIVKVITTLIKANMPVRISFQVATMNDSRVILDSNGAEKLIGRGDMLIAGLAPDPERFHGAWVSDEEITAVTDSLKGA